MTTARSYGCFVSDFQPATPSWPASGGPPNLVFDIVREEKQPAVYMITNMRNGAIYVGVTGALWNRICDHKNGTFEGFSKRYKLGMLVWYEHHPTMLSAIHREKRLKKWNRDWKTNLINAFNSEWRDLHDDIDSNVNRVEEFTTRKVFSEGRSVGGPPEAGHDGESGSSRLPSHC